MTPHTKVLVLLAISLWTNARNTVADIDSGCPSWGCLPTGTYSLSARVPASNGKVRWSTEVDHVDGDPDILGLCGCVSDQVAVVCATQRGYVSLDPLSGKQLWNYTSMKTPYLPVMDIYGDLIGMDSDKITLISQNGQSEHPINISVLQPAFSVMLANDSMLLLTSSSPDTAQIVTYGTDGIVSGAIPLRGTVERGNGTFIPISHPVIAGYRAYILTQFSPDRQNHSSPDTQPSLGMHRLYALDLWDHMTQRIRVAWYFNLERETRWPGVTYPPNGDTEKKGRGGKMKHSYKEKDHSEEDVVYVRPVMTYFKGTVYVNFPDVPVREGGQSEQPVGGSLWAFRDNGDDATLIFKNTDAVYGQMVVYSTFDDPIGQSRHEEEDIDHTLWVLTISPPVISGYSTKNGSQLIFSSLFEAANISIVTSKMAITRQSNSATKDTIIFAGQDAGVGGGAVLVAVEADSSSKARMLWKAKLVDDNPPTDSVYWTPVGQIVNVAQQTPGTSGTMDWRFGVIVPMVEQGKGYYKLHAKAVF